MAQIVIQMSTKKVLTVSLSREDLDQLVQAKFPVARATTMYVDDPDITFDGDELVLVYEEITDAYTKVLPVDNDVLFQADNGEPEPSTDG